MALVDYGFDSEEEDKNSDKERGEDEFFGEDQLATGSAGGNAAKPVEITQDDELEDVVKSKDWEKKLAEKEKRKREKKAAKKERREKRKADKISKQSAAVAQPPKPKKRAQIPLFGSLPTFEDDSDEEEAAAGPSTKPSGVGNGLLGLLPAPKTNLPTSTTSKQRGILIPSSVKLKPTTVVAKPVPKPVDPESDDDEDFDTDFFGLRAPAAPVPGGSEDSVHIPIMPSTGLDSEVGPSKPNQEEYVHPSQMYNCASVDSTPAPKGVITDAMAHRLIMERESDMTGRGMTDILANIKDVNVRDALGPNVHAQLLKNITAAQLSKTSLPAIPKVEGGKNSAERKKNQITYLAQLAVAREETLQERRADSRHTQRLAKQKYGF